MSTSAPLLEQLLSLPAAERAEIAERLLESLDELDPHEIEGAWASEVAARVDALRNGEAVTRDAFEALDALEQELARRGA